MPAPCRKPYLTDRTDEHWAILQPMIPPAKPGGRPREVAMREMLNTILSLTRTGCQWDLLPHDLLPKSTVYEYFAQWQRDGTWQQMMDTRRAAVRKQQAPSQEPTPSVASIERQTVKTPEQGGERGEDGGKKLTGRTRHISVDILGLLVVVFVSRAAIDDAVAAPQVLQHLGLAPSPRLEVIWADTKYHQHGLNEWIATKSSGTWRLEVVRRPAGRKGCVLLPTRWVVERTVAWLGHGRRNRKDYERRTASSESMLQVSAIHRMLKRRSCRSTMLLIPTGSKRGMISASITSSKGLMMRSDLARYLVTGIFLILLVLLTHWRWSRSTPAPPQPTRRQRAPKPFAGYTRQPECELCEQEGESHPQRRGAAPPRLTCTRGRRRQGDTTGHCCPHTACADHGRVDFGNLRATGQPNGRRWRPLVGLGCRGSVLETVGTPFHAKPVAPDKLVWASAALAEGFGIRAVARVFEVDPKTVLGWWIEAAEHLETFTRYHFRDLHVEQVQMDELFAWLSAVKAGEVTEAEAMKRLSRSPHWVWVAMEPVCKLMLAVEGGDRTLAMAQRLVHQVIQMLAPECAPRFLTEGFRESLPALVTHDGQWMPPERRQATGPQPKPRWMPGPGLLYAQVVKSYRRRRMVGVKHRLSCGAAQPIESILAKRGGKINTSCVERLTLDFRQHVAALGRRVHTLGKHEVGLRQQLALFQVYHNVALPHASLRLPLPECEPIHGTGAVKHWQPQTPAMAAGRTDRVWSLRDVLRYRVPPWPQPEEDEGFGPVGGRKPQRESCVRKPPRPAV